MSEHADCHTVKFILPFLSVCGHDTAEDAAACMELMLWKAKEDGKLKK